MAKSHSSTAKLQVQIDDTVGAMRENINKVKDRGFILNNVDDSMSDLNGASQLFYRGANQTRKKFWLKEMKTRLCLAALVIIVMVVVIVVVMEVKKKVS